MTSWYQNESRCWGVKSWKCNFVKWADSNFCCSSPFQWRRDYMYSNFNGHIGSAGKLSKWKRQQPYGFIHRHNHTFQDKAINTTKGEITFYSNKKRWSRWSNRLKISKTPQRPELHGFELTYSELQKRLLWASYQIRSIEGCACAGNTGNVLPATAG